MLQQTQVSRVEDYYRRFLDRYPTVTDLAAAAPRSVRDQWDGLGYYRRAENLHRLARLVVAEYDGRIPADTSRLMALPGIGRYTAGAIASFAYEQAEPAVDTNVARVLRRAFHPRAGDRAADHRKLWATAAKLIPAAGGDAWAFNQGIMELGALICTARIARCAECPARRVCATGKRATVARAPRRSRPTTRTPRRSSRAAPAGPAGRRKAAPGSPDRS